MRCTATTKKSTRCKMQALKGSSFCRVHRERFDIGEFGATVIGGLVGNVLAPGVGGIVAGGVASNFIHRIRRNSRMSKKRVFVSFDFDNDRQLKDFIVGQSRLVDSPFEIVDHSLKEAAPEANWETKARAAIARADVVIVMVGPHTYRAHGVLKEVAMAKALNKYIVQIIGYRDGDYTAVPGAGRLYRWNWENLKKILS